MIGSVSSLDEDGWIDREWTRVTPESRSSGIERFDGRLPKVITDTLRRLF